MVKIAFVMSLIRDNICIKL